MDGKSDEKGSIVWAILITIDSHDHWQNTTAVEKLDKSKKMLITVTG